jgi:hypothetical protein
MERAATRMLAQKLRARNLLETHENNLISHLCTPTIPGSSTRDKSLYSLKPKTLPALSAIGIYQDHASQGTTQSNPKAINGTHKLPPPRHSAKTPTRRPPTSPARPTAKQHFLQRLLLGSLAFPKLRFPPTVRRTRLVDVQMHRAFDLVEALGRRQFWRAVDERCDARGDWMGRQSGRVACQAISQPRHRLRWRFAS